MGKNKKMKRRLGRGLSSLLGSTSADADSDQGVVADDLSERVETDSVRASEPAGVEAVDSESVAVEAVDSVDAVETGGFVDSGLSAKARQSAEADRAGVTVGILDEVGERAGEGVTEEEEAVTGEAVTVEAAGGVDVGSGVGGGRFSARMVRLDALRPNRFQPRQTFDSERVRELADSIVASGMIQPIVAREDFEGGSYEIIAGERRWRAAKIAGLTEAPVLVRRATEEQMLEWALVENIHREDLSPVERAEAYRRYCDAFELKATEVAERLGEDRSTVMNYIRLLELPREVLDFLSAERIGMGHARTLLGAGDERRMVQLAHEVVRKSLTVRKLEGIVRREKEGRGSGSGSGIQNRSSGGGHGKTTLSHIKALETRFEEIFESKVRLQLAPSGTRGRIVIEFFDIAHFEGICKKVGVIPKKKG